MITSKK